MKKKRNWRAIIATSMLIVLTIVSVRMLVEPPITHANACSYSFDGYKRVSWDGFNCLYFTRYCRTADGGLEVGYEHDCGINFW
jgi:hypothetical protein